MWRFREVAVCVALTALSFFQAPGLVVADSKIDLALNPVGWLARSMHLWDPAGSFGQLQNQAYGYLWPMGPFFAGGALMGVPGWVMQRLWWALLMCVAFTGVIRLANRLGIGTPMTRMVAGIAFALSPRILTEVGALSIEAWPSAIAPWVLVPLVGLAKGASIRRSVALSALAVACAGGVNATAVFAVVPLAVIWLLTLAPARRRVEALLAWCAAVLCATAWWLLPLVVLGRYSPPFLDYIESAAATTGATDAITVLRGASHWVAYLRGPFGASLPAGWDIATDAVIAGATIVVAALGLAGLSRRGMPHRRFLVAGLTVGLAMVGLGHVSDLPATFAQAQRDFLDGIGAPLRNVHKFDVLLRLPLMLGLAHLLGVYGRVGAFRRKGLRYAPAPAAVVGATAFVAIVAVAAPALAGNLAPGQRVQERSAVLAVGCGLAQQQRRRGARTCHSGRAIPELHLGQHSRRDHPAAAVRTVGRAQRHPAHPARDDPHDGCDRVRAIDRLRVSWSRRLSRPVRCEVPAGALGSQLRKFGRNPTDPGPAGARALAGTLAGDRLRPDVASRHVRRRIHRSRARDQSQGAGDLPG